MVFAPNELTVVSPPHRGLDMPSSPRIPFDANFREPAPTRARGRRCPDPRKLSMLDSPEVDDVDAAVDAPEASGEASD